MVYKKYIKKDGKLYGPYIYESKRIDGKVVSEYHGHKKGMDIKKFDWIFISAILVLFFAYFLSLSNFGEVIPNVNRMTGDAILNKDVNSTEKQNNESFFEPEFIQIIPENLQIINATTNSVLTDEEKTLLAEEFGSDITPKHTESKLINGRLIGKYEIGSQWIGYSYDANLAKEDLEYQMSTDMIKWLKDLAYRLKVEKTDYNK
jgi:hypothetical protein